MRDDEGMCYLEESVVGFCIRTKANVMVLEGVCGRVACRSGRGMQMKIASECFVDCSRNECRG
jgi:hypothetical protein